eukprot:GFYU01002176.1.p1 GENE.GFYU01002176.1~~GFYU01002176.1.p1  ORF type:complete len:499 (+),score=186.02 GFYU01002176.1:200-1696(+)
MGVKKAKKGGEGSGKVKQGGAAAEEKVSNQVEEVWTRKTLDEYKQRVKELRDECSSLQATLQTKDEDTGQILGYLKSESLKKDSVISNLEKLVEEQQKTFEKQYKDLDERWGTEFEQEKDKLTMQVNALQEERGNLLKELTALREFKELKDIVEEELNKTKLELDDARESHVAQVAALERKYYEEKARVKKETKVILDDLKKKSQEEAMEKLDQQTKKVMAENRRIVDELQFQTKQTMELTKVMREVDEDNRRLIRDAEIKDQTLKETTIKGSRQTREIRSLQQKIQTLEVSLSQVVRDFERERENMKMKQSKDKEEARIESSGLRHLVKLRTKELQNIKKLAQVILAQRTDLEDFFLQALDHVKSEVAKRSGSSQRKRAKRIGGGGIKLPKIDDAELEDDDGAAEAYAANPSETVDIKDLAWEDKERVLRLLFAKMNLAHQKNYTHSAGSKHSLGNLKRELSQGTDKGGNQSEFPSMHEVPPQNYDGLATKSVAALV